MTTPLNTYINSNGSRWYGEAPATIEDLLNVLKIKTLDRWFELHGNFILEGDEGTTRFFGNFFDVSHVFHIITNDPEVVERLTTAIRTNQQKPEYLAQDAPTRAVISKKK